MYFMKNIYIGVIFLFLLGSSALFADNAKLQKTRVAIFDEAGFPNKSGRSIDWFKQSISAVGGNANVIGLKELQAAECFSRDKYDTIVFPHGGYVPLDAEEALGRFMNQGGSVIIAGDIFGELPYPSDVKVQYQKISKDFQEQRGGKIEEYGNFLLKNGLTESCFVRYSPEDRKSVV